MPARPSATRSWGEIRETILQSVPLEPTTDTPIPPPLNSDLTHVCWSTECVDHAWGSRGRRFKSCQPDIVKGQLSWPFSFIFLNLCRVARHSISPVRSYRFPLIPAFGGPESIGAAAQAAAQGEALIVYAPLTVRNLSRFADYGPGQMLEPGALLGYPRWMIATPARHERSYGDLRSIGQDRCPGRGTCAA
jgi:hypothetical protein